MKFEPLHVTHRKIIKQAVRSSFSKDLTYFHQIWYIFLGNSTDGPNSFWFISIAEGWGQKVLIPLILAFNCISYINLHDFSLFAHSYLWSCFLFKFKVTSSWRNLQFKQNESCSCSLSLGFYMHVSFFYYYYSFQFFSCGLLLLNDLCLKQSE